QGARVLAVARVAPDGSGRILGLIALADPPRADAAPLIAALAARGVRTVMATGDSAETAAAIAAKVGLAGPAFAGGPFPERLDPASYAVFAGVLPEDKYHLVRALQAEGHVAGMCGDGANDAPALRQAGIGIAVASATDVAKAAAGIVLTEPGLSGVLAAIEEGRATFRRLLTYTLTMLVRKLVVVAYLFLGLLLTGGAVLTPLLMVLFLVSNDFLTMSLATDNATPRMRPEVWRMDAILRAGIVFGLAELGFALAVLAAGQRFGLGLTALRTLGFTTLMASTQASLFALRTHDRIWHSRPGGWILASSVAGLVVTLVVALPGIVAAPIAPMGFAGALAAALVFALVLDAAKGTVFARSGLG
ncbi:MAG: HAD-IC family P-type ATPase, partial [Rhodospirillales bacterium]|nr:HAD-IC family P-type ATPase [Rhodospirillales bacterium]